MPTLDDVYRKYGEASEAAQLFETDLGTMLLFVGAVDEGLITPSLEVDSEGARDLMRRIDRQTLGQLVRNARRQIDGLADLEPLLATALEERNRLAHSFYRHHNLRRNSDAGRTIMMDDLESIHEKVLAAWKAVNRLMGVDLDAITAEMISRENGHGDGSGEDGPLTHLPIYSRSALLPTRVAGCCSSLRIRHVREDHGQYFLQRQVLV